MYIYRLSLSTLLIAIVALQKTIAVDDTKLHWIQEQIVQELKLSSEPNHIEFLEALKQLDAMTQSELTRSIYRIIQSNFFHEHIEPNASLADVYIFDDQNEQELTYPSFSVTEQNYPTLSVDIRVQIAERNLQLRV